MTKPKTRDGYDPKLVGSCERLLVTLLRGLGPWKDSLVLVGGLTPRYLVKARPPAVPAHAGTADVDVVVDFQVLVDVEAYQTFEQNLTRLGFERCTNDRNQKVNWRWQKDVDGAALILEFLAEKPDAGRRVEALPTKGNVSAVNIPHANIVFDHNQAIEITAELLDGNGIVTEIVRHADTAAFVTLKAFAFKDRNERKDAHDLVYCLEHADDPDAVVQQFKVALVGKHGKTFVEALDLLRADFLDDSNTEGYLKAGPVAVARFELGELDEDTEFRSLRQREVSALLAVVLGAI